MEEVEQRREVADGREVLLEQGAIDRRNEGEERGRRGRGATDKLGAGRGVRKDELVVAVPRDMVGRGL